jgi:hypothetical protein
VNPPRPAGSGLSPAWRVPLLVLGFVALASGTGAGLARLGLPLHERVVSWAALHGPLMICGFFGVVISLERAVAIGRLWPYLSVLLAGLANAALLGGQDEPARWLYMIASAGLLAASLDIARRQPALFTATLALGAACWCAGNLLWLRGAGVAQVMPWWLAFLVLTIAGERLELSRLLPPSTAARALFALLLAVVIAGLGGQSTTVGSARGGALVGAGLVGLALWLLKQDIARRTVRQAGLTRYIAVCLLAGYAWLAVGGGLFLIGAPLQPGSAAYDVALHALGLGFVFSMVLGHAPIIFPAVLRVNVPYHAAFYAPLALLHGSLLLRVVGDATGEATVLRAGGAANALALAAFIFTTAAAAWRGSGRRLSASSR